MRATGGEGRANPSPPPNSLSEVTVSTQQEQTPTMTELTEIGTAGAQAVNPETQTPEQATVAVKAAVTEKAQELRVTLEPEAVDAIATATISKLEAMGAFRKPQPPAQPAQGEGTGEQSVESPAGNAATPPEKKTLAQKLLG